MNSHPYLRWILGRQQKDLLRIFEFTSAMQKSVLLYYQFKHKYLDPWGSDSSFQFLLGILEYSIKGAKKNSSTQH